VLYLQSGISDGKAARNLTYVAPVHQQGLDTTTPAGKAMFQTARARNARCGMAAVKSGSSAMKEALQSTSNAVFTLQNMSVWDVMPPCMATVIAIAFVCVDGGPVVQPDAEENWAHR
jgi:hypothetical protein